MLKDYNVTKKFLGGTFAGLVLTQKIVNCSKVPFEVGQIVKKISCSPSFEVVRVEVSKYDRYFEAGFRAGKKALSRNPNADKATAEKLYGKVSNIYGHDWIAGFCGAVDLSRGAYATIPARRAKTLSLGEVSK